MKIAFVLSGGGSKGSFQVGVLKGLAEKGVVPDCIFGTSTGAINAAGYSTVGPDKLEKIWLSLKRRSCIFQFNWKSLLFKSQGIFNLKPLKKLLKKHCSGISLIPTIVTKVHINSGRLEHIHSSSENFLESVAASAAIPGIAEPVNGYVDGAVVSQSPLQIVFDSMPEVETIVVILCNPIHLSNTETSYRNWTKNALRAVDILQHAVFLKDIQSCLNKNDMDKYRPVNIDIYAPTSHFGGCLNFAPESILLGIQHGKEIAKAGPVKSMQAGR